MAPGDQGAAASGDPSAGTARGAPPADAVPPGTSPADAHAQAAGDDPFERRPELLVGAAFAGGLVLAQILRRIGR